MRESYESLRAELKGRSRFETLLAEISAHFVNLPADRIDSTIEDAHGADTVTYVSNIYKY
jgi:hypothetical protein